MRKIYSLALAAATALSASADTGSWVVVEDFENFEGTPAVWNMYGSNATGTTSIEIIEKDGNADNHAAKFMSGDYNSGLEFDITLPEGKTIADYDGIGLDVYNIDMQYKELLIYIDGTQVAKQSNAEGKKNEWTERTYELSTSGAASTFKMQVIFKIKDGAFAVDNLRLKEKQNSGEPVEPGTYAESANGTTTDGWLMVQDYQTKAPGDVVTMGGQYGNTSGDGEIIVDPTDATNLAASFTGGDYNTVFKVDVTLPEGKALKDYKTVGFDIYRYSDDDNYKQMLVKAGDEIIFLHESGGYEEQGKAGVWTEKTYAIDEATAVGNSFTLLFGIKNNKAHYAVDRVRLEERGEPTEPEEPEEPAEPIEYHETQNGQTVNGAYMANDFQHHAASDVELPTWSHTGGASGTAKTASAPDDEKNLVAHFTGGNYNTVHEIDVTLPEGKTLKNFTTLKFDLYRNSTDNNYKKMYVAADDEVLHHDEDYVQQAPSAQWTEKSYDIPKSTAVGNTFKLRAGIESNQADYMIDNVRLVARTTTGIEDISAEAAMGVAASNGNILLAGHGTAAVYTADGRTIATVAVNCSAAVAVAPGLYIVALSDGTTAKILVK